MAEEEGFKVLLNVYDLSQGIARQLSMTFLGKVIEAIWHTGVVVYGNEYYFGSGIHHDIAGRTPYGTPVRVIDLSVTHVPKDVFEMYLQEISPRYTGQTYSLLTHNCNNFSNEVAQFLVGATIPDYILNLPSEVMSSPAAPLIMPMIQQMETTMRSGAVPLSPQFTPSLVPSSQPAKTVNNGSQEANKQKVGGKEVEGRPSNHGKSKISEISVVSPAVKPAEAQEKSPANKVAGDALGDARSKVQEEINNEFAAIMATGTLRASEAAALAARRVMQKYGYTNEAKS